MSCGRKLGPFDCCSVVQGDCLELMKQLPDGCVDAVITSPPYWDARDYCGLPFKTYAQYLDFVRGVMCEVRRTSKWVAWVAGYIWRDGRMFDCPGDAARIAEECGLIRRQQVPWVKPDYAPQPSIDLAPAHELIEILSAPDAHPFKELRVERRELERLGRVATERPSGGSQRGGAAGWGYERFDGMKQAPNVLVVNKLNGATDDYWGHPAAYPPQIAEPWVEALSREGSVILDPFCGSATTLAVAAKLGRHFLGFELSADYCRIARERIAAVEAQPTLFPPSAAEQLTLQ